jgi:protein gp37
MLGPIELDSVHLQGRWLENLHWVIVGESGRNARPCEVAWIRDLVQQCKDAGVACFVKQLGASYFDPPGTRRFSGDKKGGDPSEWPEDLRVREFPKEATA